MLVICSECDKKLKISDSHAGKKIRCPDCKGVIQVPEEEEAPKPRKPAAGSAAPVKKAPRPPDDEDEDSDSDRRQPSPRKGTPPKRPKDEDDEDDRPIAKKAARSSRDLDDEDDLEEEDEKPAGKKSTKRARDEDEDDEEAERPRRKSAARSGNSRKWLWVGAGVGLAAAAGILIWILVGGSGGGPTQITLANPVLERVGDQIKVSVDYDAANVQGEDKIGCLIVYPSMPNKPRMVRFSEAKDIRGAPKGRWVSELMIVDLEARDDTICDLVVRTGPHVTTLNNEVFRLSKAEIPPSKIAFHLTNVVAKRNKEYPEKVEFSCEAKFIGPLPTFPYVALEAEFIEPGTNKRARGPFAQRGGQEVKQSETITGTVVCPFPNAELCDVLASDREPGKGNGNLALIKNLPVQSATPPVTVEVTEGAVEMESAPGNTCKVTVQAKAKSDLKPGEYRAGVVFTTLGRKQNPVAIGAPLTAELLKTGAQVEAEGLALPPGHGPMCDLVILDPALAVVGAQVNLQIAEAPKKPKERDITFTNLRIDKIDTNNIRIRFDYAFTKPIVPNRYYNFKVMHHLPNATLTGMVFHQARGDKLSSKGSIDTVFGSGALGVNKEYRVWATMGNTDEDFFTLPKASYIKIVAANAAETPKDVALSKVTVERLDDSHVRVQATYEFTREIDAKKGYAILVQRNDVDAKALALNGIFDGTVRQETGDKWQKKGQVKTDVQLSGKGAEYRVWMLEGGITISNTVVVKPGVASRDDGNEPILISAARITTFGKKGTGVEIAYKFTGLNKPNPKAIYGGFFGEPGKSPVQFFQSKAGQLPASGAFPSSIPFVITDESNLEVWIVEVSAQNSLVSNKKAAELKKN